MKSLDKLRQCIDCLDIELLRIISMRARCAQQIAQVKLNDNTNAVFYRPEREAQVLRSIIARNEGPLYNDDIYRFFREIMSACLALELPIKVAYIGRAKQAAIKHFGNYAEHRPMAILDDVFSEVEGGVVGVVKIDTGSFRSRSVRVCGEVLLQRKQSQTRFLIIARDDVPPSGDDKTSLIISNCHHKFKFKIMELFLRNIDINCLSGSAFNFIDLNPHVTVDELRFQVMGSYPLYPYPIDVQEDVQE